MEKINNTDKLCYSKWSAYCYSNLIDAKRVIMSKGVFSRMTSASSDLRIRICQHVIAIIVIENYYVYKPKLFVLQERSS